MAERFSDEKNRLLVQRPMCPEPGMPMRLAFDGPDTSKSYGMDYAL